MVSHSTILPCESLLTLSYSNSLDNGVEIQIESRDQSVWHDWRSLIKAMHLSSHRDPKALVPNSNETTLMFKIAFILFKNDSLKRNIDELEAAVADLDAFCQQIFNHRRGDMEAKKVTRSMLERSSRHKDFVRPLSIFATTLYKAQSHPDCPFRWGLELRLPDTHGDCLTWDQTHQLDLDFIVMSNVSGGSMEYSRVRIRYRPDNKDMNDAASVLPLSIVSGTAENADFERLDAPQRRSKPFSEIFKSQLLANDKNLYIAWTRERLDLMLGFTNWMFLLWDTQWTSQPCCCGIRFEQIRRNTRCHVLACQRGHSCHELLDTQHKLLSLGVVLAELTLAEHLRVRFADMDFEDQLSCQPKYPLSSTLDQGRKRCPTVQLWRTDGNGTWQEIPRERLLQDIRERSHSLELADIIEKCLYDHQMITKNPIEFLDFYNEEILKP